MEGRAEETGEQRCAIHNREDKQERKGDCADGASLGRASKRTQSKEEEGKDRRAKTWRQVERDRDYQRSR